MYHKLVTDICIIGGGSGGIGAAARILQNREENTDVILVEETGLLGGTSTIGGVNCWEPGISGPGIHYRLYEGLSQRKGQAGVGKSTHYYTTEKPWGMSEIDESLDYRATLRRAGLVKEKLRRFHFEPISMGMQMENMLMESGNIRIMYYTSFVGAKTRGDRINSIVVFSQEDGEYYEIEASFFIDCSGDIVVARDAGCETVFGEDGQERYGEISAPDRSTDTVNGVSLIFRVTPSRDTTIDDIPKWAYDTDAKKWLSRPNLPGVSINNYPNGDLNMNILPVMEGREYFSLSPSERLKICKARVYYYWNWLQNEKGFDRYTFKGFAMKIGVRESYRLVGRHVLTEADVRAGFLKQNKKDEIIAFSDHALDTHGNRNTKISRVQELDIPYGVPYSCLLDNKLINLAVACRGSSFSHIAASSCRLSRTMIALGEAAGQAAVNAIRDRTNFQELDVEELRKDLKIPEFEEEVAKIWEIW